MPAWIIRVVHVLDVPEDLKLVEVDENRNVSISLLRQNLEHVVELYLVGLEPCKNLLYQLGKNLCGAYSQRDTRTYTNFLYDKSGNILPCNTQSATLVATGSAKSSGCNVWPLPVKSSGT